MRIELRENIPTAVVMSGKWTLRKTDEYIKVSQLIGGQKVTKETGERIEGTVTLIADYNTAIIITEASVGDNSGDNDGSDSGDQEEVLLHYVGEEGEPAFENGGNLGQGSQQLYFYKENNKVTVYGVVTLETGGILFRLPEGMRPKNKIFIENGSEDSIATDGAVTIQGNGGERTVVALEFRTDTKVVRTGYQVDDQDTQQYDKRYTYEATGITVRAFQSGYIRALNGGGVNVRTGEDETLLAQGEYVEIVGGMEYYVQSEEGSDAKIEIVDDVSWARGLWIQRNGVWEHRLWLEGLEISEYAKVITLESSALATIYAMESGSHEIIKNDQVIFTNGGQYSLQPWTEYIFNVTERNTIFLEEETNSDEEDLEEEEEEEPGI